MKRLDELLKVTESKVELMRSTYFSARVEEFSDPVGEHPDSVEYVISMKGPESLMQSMSDAKKDIQDMLNKMDKLVDSIQ